ncbi:DUF2637 domain-containing protein [Streptomyces sp. NPDC056517]|uniref:DUF2637 domain-containing protein n=1 Tax=Streptomyces sp. NPDC056517 TaxID=3345848 RepID=UPI0036A22506
MHHPPELTSTQRKLVGVVIGGAVLIAGIGFAGSYAAVRELAVDKGFGAFALAFPVGLDVGIVVLLALDLLLAWLRMPFPLLRHTAWLLTAATIAFNAAAAWPDPLGVGMHAVTPVLFVVIVEAARNAVGRLADITADRHIEPVRLVRWLLAPLPTFLMWRRMKLWEMRSYREVIRFEQDRLVYRAGLEAQYGRRWRRKAPVEVLLPLRLMRYGRPLDETPETPEVLDPPVESGEFERAAAEALALAPAPAVPEPEAVSVGPRPAHVVLVPVPVVPAGPAPAPAELVLDLAPMYPPIPELTAPEPVPTFAAGVPHPPRVHARIPDPDPGEPECIDPVPVPEVHPAPVLVPEVDTNPVPEPVPEVHPNPVPVPEVDPNPVPPPVPDPEFADLVRRGQELAMSGRLTVKRAKAELRVGQSKAQQVIAAVHPQPKGP